MYGECLQKNGEVKLYAVTRSDARVIVVIRGLDVTFCVKLAKYFVVVKRCLRGFMHELV